MHICIFQTGEPLHIDDGNYRPMRAMLLAEELIKDGHKVTIISSSFFHQRKIFRTDNLKSIEIKVNLKIILIPSCGYKKNISLKRLLDHIILSFNLNKFLNKNNTFRPDKVFIGYPPIETSFVIVRWAKKHNIPVMLDVKDNWPQNYIEPFPKYFKKIARIFLSPYFMVSKYIFENSDSISSITFSFIKWIKSFSGNKNLKINYFVAPLVRKKIKIDNNKKADFKDYWSKKDISIIEGEYFVFVGSLSNSFDFELIFKIANSLIINYPKYNFIICGDGDKFEELTILFKSLNNVFLIGEVDKYHATLLIQNSIATIAPYFNNQNFNDSIPNKVIESLENGVPFITNTDGELKRLIEKYSNGIYLNKNFKDFYKIEKLIEDKKYNQFLRKNSLNSFENLFNFEKTYQKIILNLKNM